MEEIKLSKSLVDMFILPNFALDKLNKRFLGLWLERALYQSSFVIWQLVWLSSWVFCLRRSVECRLHYPEISSCQHSILILAYGFTETNWLLMYWWCWLYLQLLFVLLFVGHIYCTDGYAQNVDWSSTYYST